jgi:hypothetical protein
MLIDPAKFDVKTLRPLTMRQVEFKESFDGDWSVFRATWENFTYFINLPNSYYLRYGDAERRKWMKEHKQELLDGLNKLIQEEVSHALEAIRLLSSGR